jgi:hypothetical protein
MPLKATASNASTYPPFYNDVRTTAYNDVRSVAFNADLGYAYQIADSVGTGACAVEGRGASPRGLCRINKADDMCATSMIAFDSWTLLFIEVGIC